MVNIVTIRITTTGLEDIKKTSQAIENNVKEQMKTLAEATRSRMVKLIKKRSKHHTGNLAKAITTTRIKQTKGIGYGVGNINKMNRLAPYWAIINYGTRGRIKKMRRNYHFVPGYMRGGKFVYRPDLTGTGLRMPSGLWKAKIKPMNYIQDTITWANSILKKHLKVKK